MAKKVDASLKEKVVAAVASGLSTTAAAEKFKVCKASVRNWCNEASSKGTVVSWVDRLEAKVGPIAPSKTIQDVIDAQVSYENPEWVKKLESKIEGIEQVIMSRRSEIDRMEYTINLIREVIAGK